MLITAVITRTGADIDIPKDTWAELWDHPPATWTLHGVTGKVVNVAKTTRAYSDQVRVTMDVPDADVWRLLGQQAGEVSIGKNKR